MTDANEGCKEAEELRWRCLCLCRQISPVGSITSLLCQFPGGLCPNNQSWFIKECVDEDLITYFPRSIDFERKLLRAVVLAAESNGHELTEDLMTAFSKRLTTDAERNNNSSSQWSYKLYTYSNGNESVNYKGLLEGVREAEQAIKKNSREPVEAVAGTLSGPTIVTKGDERSGLLALHVSNDMLAGETGCWDWEAGFFLSEFIFNQPGLFLGKKILELGSGCGMAGVALARVSAASVLCTDGDVEALDNCIQNLRMNGLEVAQTAEVTGKTEIAKSEKPSIAVQRLRWEDGAATLPTASLDIVVGADLTYDPVNIPPLIKILKEILLSTADESGVVAYITTTRRSEATFKKFLDALEQEVVFQVEDVSKQGAIQAVGSKTLSRMGKNNVGFCHVASLEAARERIVLHRITRRKV